jgi:hypothetical protein
MTRPYPIAHTNRRSAASPTARLAAYAAAAWGLSFAAVHAYWAAGGTGGLEGERVTGALLAIDVVAIPLCLVAAVLGLATVHPSLWPAPRWTLRAGAWTAGVLLGLRGLTGVIQTALGQSGDAPWGVVAADPFFLLGGLLFGAVAVLDRRAPVNVQAPRGADGRPGPRWAGTAASRASTRCWPGRR